MSKSELIQEVERLRDVLVSKHGGEPLALLKELDAARAEIERLRAEDEANLGRVHGAMEEMRALRSQRDRLLAAAKNVAALMRRAADPESDPICRPCAEVERLRAEVAACEEKT